MTAPPQDLLVLVYVHGFKGNEVTFESFPERIAHLLQATHPSLKVESRVFPAYQTRGELKAATLAFVDWLTTLVVTLENNHGAGGGAGKARVVLIGHSMGGLLIADAALDIAANTRDKDPMWPRVLGITAFDTPYLGLHPHTFKHHLSQAASHMETARTIAGNLTMLSPIAAGLGFGKFGKSTQAESSSSSSRNTSPSGSTKGKEKATTVEPSSGPVPAATPAKSFWSMPPLPAPSTKTWYGIGALALGAAAAGTAYYRRDDLFNGWKYGYDHLNFVGNLWDEAAMKKRLVDVAELCERRNVVYRNYYTHIPPTPPKYLVTRTFTVLPPLSHPLFKYWRPATNTMASDEVHAHMSMFNPKTNDGFYDLGLEVVGAIGERVEEEGVGRETVLGDDLSFGTEEVNDGLEEKEMGISDMGGFREEKDEKGNSVLVEI